MASEKMGNPEKNQEYIATCKQRGCKYTFRISEDQSIRIGRKAVGLVFVVDEEGCTWVEAPGGKRFMAEVAERTQNKYHIIINGNSYFFTIETPFSFKRRKFLTQLTKGKKTSRLESPMPGKIVEVLVNEGDSVSTGDPLIILEAMKMQNEILAENGGVISKIHVKSGQNVMKDEILLEMGP
jgi:glutaconyl-CoA/methylmalonyl-CoA decarboxylase subunit gamma